MTDDNYGISSHWYGDSESPAAIGAKFLQTLDDLGPLDPAMSNWRLVDMVTYDVTTIDDIRPRITELVENNVRQDEWDPEPPGGGYVMIATGSKVFSEVITPRRITVSLNAGSKWDNDIKFEIGGLMMPADPALLTYPIFRGAVEIIASIWPCPWVNAYAMNLGKLEPLLPAAPVWRDEWSKPYQAPVPDWLYWIGYLSPPLAAGLTPPPELIAERTPGGGLILSAVQERFDLANPDHRRRGVELTKIMNERTRRGASRSMPPTEPPRIGPY